MTVHAYASWPHYFDHLFPVLREVPESHRGTFFAPRHVIAARPDYGLVEGVPSEGPVLVAGYVDHHAVRPLPTILVNHGAGQSYVSTRSPESFSGGPNRDRVRLHLEPGPLAARASAAAGHPFAVVGMPLMDRWHAKPLWPQPGLVAVALHHNGRGAPEQGSAWPHYADAFAGLAAAGVNVLGHGHPRGWERTANQWRRLGVTPEPDFGSVLDRAALLITDVSSAGPMFASTGRPVVFVSAPWHLAAPVSGGRFFDWVDAVDGVGGHVTDPADLRDAVCRTLADPAPLVAAQSEMVTDVFYACDGLAASRAADAVVGLLNGQ